MESNHSDIGFINVDFKAFYLIIKRNKAIILLVNALFLIFAILVRNIQSNEYLAMGKIMPEVSYSSNETISYLEKLAVSFAKNNPTANSTPLELYSEIINSTDFVSFLFKQNVVDKMQKKYSFQSFCKKFLTKNVNELTTENLQELEKRITITSDRRSGIMYVSAKMPDPAVASQLVNYTIQYLTEYIRLYKTEKAADELNFLEKTLAEHRNVRNFDKNIEKALQGSIIGAKIKINSFTPILRVLEKPKTPTLSEQQKTKNRFLIINLILGLIIGIIVAIFKNKNYRMLLANEI